MPRKISLSREQILDAAFALVRSEGIEALSARALATRLACSTQPVYRAFGSMESLRAAVTARAVDHAMGLFHGGEATYLASGMGILRFITEEPHLFSLVWRSEATIRAMVAKEPLPEAMLVPMRAMPELQGLDDEQLRRVHTMLWFIAQGAAVLFERDDSEEAQKLARSYGSLAGTAIIEWVRRKRTEGGTKTMVSDTHK
ncbi:MAG: helix-turn-helix domain-containing protein [Pseudomonadota bacterium]